VAIIRDEQGAEYALMECPHCESYEMHAPADGYPDTFQCAQCFAMFRHLD
jgi:hypothetical protein